MPRLANERQELYCTHRAKGAVPKKAMVMAGYAQGSANHTELENDPEVQHRILELTQEYQLKREQQRAAAMQAAEMVGKVTGVTKAWVIEKLAENAIAAAQEGAFKESNEALKLIGDEYGMFKGSSGIADTDGEGVQQIDMEQTERLLNVADRLPPFGEAAERPPIDHALVERLTAGNKPVSAKERELTNNPETNVAMSADADTDSD